MWNKRKVVMLSTEKASVIGQSTISKNLGLIDKIKTKKETNQKEELVDATPFFQLPKSQVKFYHIHFLSDEEIKEGDCVWVGDRIVKAVRVNGLLRYLNLTSEFYLSFQKGDKKIIASTDESLGLPKPSRAFIGVYINAYNEEKPITDVMVEYKEDYEIDWENSKEGTFSEDSYQATITTEILKVDKDNTINIRKVKDSWNREEHCLDMQYYMEYCLTYGYVSPMKWLDELKHY